MKLTACFATLAMAEKVPRDDCIDNGIESPLDHRFYVDHIKCDKNNIMCKPICAKNAVINSNRKRYHCDKRGNEYRWKPVNPAIFPQCRSCSDVGDLAERVEVDGDPRFDLSITISCPLGESLSSSWSGNWNTNWAKFNCKCNKRAKECRWETSLAFGYKTFITSSSQLHRFELEEVECVEAVKNPPSTGLRLPPGLTCKRKGGMRIVDGQEADPNTWPWLVQLESNGYFNCGGVIVDENLVLTAAHCCEMFGSIDSITGRVGSLDKGSGEVIKFKKQVMHPKYDKPNREIENDICLLFPTKPIEMIPGSIDRACLPNQDEQKPPAGTRCWTAGFGNLWLEGLSPTKLMEVDVQLFGDDECAATYAGDFYKSSMHTCAGWPETRKSSCNGDSGGPLICVTEDKQPMLWGLTSMGLKCGDRNSPGMYTRVEKYIGWIAKLVEEQRHN